MSPAAIDLDRLLKLRLVVARFGEMDLAKWWNTKGQLGRLGAAALRRGFPRTHHFAQARSVFAVAAHRCAEVFDPPGCVTLWRLPEAIEEEFDARWEHWLDHADDWTPFFEKLEDLQGTDLVAVLRVFELVSDRDVESVREAAPLGRRPRGAAPGRVLGQRTPTSRCWPSASRGAKPARSRFPTRGERRMKSSLARERRLVLHDHQGRDDRRDLRRLRGVGLRSFEAREPRPPSRRELHRRQQRDVAPRRRQGAEPPLRPDGRDRPLVVLAKHGCRSTSGSRSSSGT